MNVSAPFIRRPIATTLLAVAILIAGMVAYKLLAVSPLPRVDFPTLSVQAALPGASPETMAAAVATPLERRFGRIAGITEITSTSSIGSVQITMQFDLERDVDSAARDVQAAIGAAAGELPTNMPTRPNYRKVNPADTPILILALTSDALPLSRVFEEANTVLAQKISQVEGVGQVFVGGGQQPAVRVQIDPAKLTSTGLSLEDVRATIASSTVDQPKGSLTGPNISQTIGANDQLFGAKAFEGLILRHVEGAALRLRDVARVIDDVENNRVAAWADGRRAVLCIVRRQPGANIIETTERVKRLLPSLATSISPAIKLEVAVDRTETIRASVEDVEKTLLISIGLVIAVVFVFLRSARATVIPSVAVPLSLVGTFGVMYLLDYSLDNLSLMALTIATGFVVDDAIVVTENVTRFLEAGVEPIEAALRGAKQIGFTIVSITASLLAVFIPILLMGGIVGRLFREFAVVLSIAIAISAVVSLTLTPMMCSRLLRTKSEEKKPGLFDRASEAFFDGMLRGYAGALRWVLRHRPIVGALTILTISLTVYLYVIVPKGLFPQQDTGMLMGFSEAPQDISFPAMLERQTKLNQLVQTDPEVLHSVSFMGGGPGGSAGNTGTVFIALRPRSVRKTTADAIINRLRPQIAKVDGITLFLQSMQDVRIGGRLARTQYQYTLQDSNLDELLTWAPKMLDALRKIPELKDVNTDQQTSGRQITLKIDRDTASRLGVTPTSIDGTLSDAYGQRQVATTYTQANPYRVVLEVKPELATTPDALEKLYVGSPGGPVPLSAVTKIEEGPTALSVNHQGQFPSTTISFNLAPGKAMSDAVSAIEKARLTIGAPATVQGSFSGTAQAFQSSLSSQPFLILAALIAVYIVLGVLYESYIHPITILSTLPSAGVGALLALILFKTEFSIIALVGILLLIGIVKKNAIMMIDFAIEVEREEGKTPAETIYQACVLRFRPIMMTTLAALFGGLPLA
ncbi:MAG: efflux RND transporter permease subunit, partial [Polyangiales bacterium]